MRIDAAKRNALQLLGWIVILVTADDLRTADTRHRFIEMAHVVVSRQRNLADWNRSWAITSSHRTDNALCRYLLRGTRQISGST